MSENTNRRHQDFAKFDAMSTEELEEILRLDLDAPPEQESDTEVLLTIMEILAQRKKESGNKAFEALESFRLNYMPEEDQTTPILHCKKKTYSRTPSRWLRTLAATVAVVALILLSSVTAKAFGWDIWDAVIKWTEDTFHISIGDINGFETDGDTPFTSLLDALERNDVTINLVPTWLPDGYTLTSITVEETPLQKTYTAIYHNDALSLHLVVFEYVNIAPEYVEQGEGLIETYERDGIKYYIFSNYDKMRAVWINGSYECYISGNLSVDELKMMIDSIGKE